MGERKVRADLLLVEKGLVETREKARALIMAGVIKANGVKVAKPGQKLLASAPITIVKSMPYVSRGGLKLAPALDAFQLEVKDKITADIGCSTGGFTDCLLKRGAKKVYAVDVSINQLDAKLRFHPKVIPLEENARYLRRQDFAESPQLIVMDVSFISVLKILPALKDVSPEADVVALLKPQFEAEKGRVGKKGVIREASKQIAILTRVLGQAQEIGFFVHKLFPSPVKGQKGNQEFFVHWGQKGFPVTPQELAAMATEVVYGKKN